MTAKEQPSSRMQVWHLSYPEGEVRCLLNDLSNYSGVSLTADASTIATVQGEQHSSIWIAPGGDADRARQITDSRNDGNGGLAWTPDGRLVYCSFVSGNGDIWITDADGRNRKQLTDNAGLDNWPSVPADGRYAVFASLREGKQNIWRMEIDGSNPVQLTNGSGEFWPHCSPDGRWVYYSSLGLGSNGGPLWKIPIEGGSPVLVTDEDTAAPIVSPDQKLLAYDYSDIRTNPPYGVKALPLAGGQPIARFQLDPDTLFRWMPDGRGLAYIDDRYLNVWAQPLDGGKPVQLTKFKSDQTYHFDWSRDGKQLALARGTRTLDVVLISDFK